MSTDASPPTPIPTLILRALVGGVLMGLANLVPGISGGTMLLASGVYPRFIGAVAEVTTFRFRMPSLVVLGSVVAAAGVAILLLAGVVKDLVVTHRWVMYSLFIGLTLGGVPVVWALVRERSVRLWSGLAAGFIVMALLALVQGRSLGVGESTAGNFVLMFCAGLAGSSAMILPGVSGGYLLLVLGQYVPILSGIDAFKQALKAVDIAAAMDPALGVMVPVGLGVVVGVAGVSNLLKLVLDRWETVTHGVLLGLLLGAVVGLWPFQAGHEPQPGDVVKGRVMTVETIAALEPEDYPTAFFRPGAGQVFGALGLILVGFGATAAVSRLGKDRPSQPA